MNLFAIYATLWRHKWATIPMLILIVVGLFYVGEVKAPVYQAQADVVLTNPPVPPTAMEIAQDPKLAKANNPYANLGSLVYVADVMAQLVSAPATQQALEKEGAGPGYEVAVNGSNSTNTPPTIGITGVGSSAHLAIQSASLVASAISRDLFQLQASQHVENGFMITAVEYVTPSSATVSSSGKVQLAAGVIVIGCIALLVAVSAAEGLEERKKGRPQSGKQRTSHVDRQRGTADSTVADAQYVDQPHTQYAGSRPHYGEPQRAVSERVGDPRSAGPIRRQGMNSAVGNNGPWD